MELKVCLPKNLIIMFLTEKFWHTFKTKLMTEILYVKKLYFLIVVLFNIIEI